MPLVVVSSMKTDFEIYERQTNRQTQTRCAHSYRGSKTQRPPTFNEGKTVADQWIKENMSM